MTALLITPEMVHRALQFACSQNPQELKQGEQQLAMWDKERGFYSGLIVSHVVPHLSHVIITP